eukprot:evm.model.scf_1032EXC.3 EVM.evm.TU.scf_1032EXC.3   scf_1032EXC:29386-37212(-)
MCAAASPKSGSLVERFKELIIAGMDPQEPEQGGDRRGKADHQQPSEPIGFTFHDNAGRLCIPVILFNVSAGPSSLGRKVLRKIITTRHELAHEYNAYLSVLAISDGHGSIAPQTKMPRNIAVQQGLSDTVLNEVLECTEQGTSMAGNGYSSIDDVIEMAGQAGCCVLDVGDAKPHKRAKAFLSGLLNAGSRGYFGVVIANREGEELDRLKGAFTELLVLEEESDEWDVVRRVVEWYPTIESVARAEPQKTDALREPVPSEGQVTEVSVHRPTNTSPDLMADLMATVAKDPPGVLSRIKGGDVQTCLAAANLFTSLNGNPNDLLEQYFELGLAGALMEQASMARSEPRNNQLWMASLACAIAFANFDDKLGEDIQDELVIEEELNRELRIAAQSRHIPVRKVARSGIAMLDSNYGMWRQFCDNAACDREETMPREFMFCRGCKCAAYCSRECQKADWRRHKAECGSFASL